MRSKPISPDSVQRASFKPRQRVSARTKGRIDEAQAVSAWCLGFERLYGHVSGEHLPMRLCANML